MVKKLLVVVEGSRDADASRKILRMENFHFVDRVT